MSFFDAEAYLDRIGAPGARTVRDVHRAHVASIPFENLDPRRGVPVSLEAGDLQRKLVAERRGGYCFEQNLLLAGALEALGFGVEPMLARVRYGAPPDAIRPRSHLLLRVHEDGVTWHADVGFGRGTLVEPVPFGPGEAREMAGWCFRVVADGEELVLQTMEDSGWRDLYGFIPSRVPLVDIETSNWFTSTHPRSPFVTGLIASIQRLDGTRVTLTDWGGELAFSQQLPAETTVTPVTQDEIPALLEDHFGLSGVPLGPAVVNAD